MQFPVQSIPYLYLIPVALVIVSAVLFVKAREQMRLLATHLNTFNVSEHTCQFKDRDEPGQALAHRNLSDRYQAQAIGLVVTAVLVQIGLILIQIQM